MQHSLIEKWMKGCILFFSKNGDFEITKNCRNITLTALAAKVYHTLLLNWIWHKIEKILWKNQNGFWRNHSTTLQILTIHWIIKGVWAKNLKATQPFLDFFKAFDSLHIWSSPKNIMLHKNMKAVVCSPDGDTNFFDKVAGVLQGYLLAPYLFILCLDYIFQTSIDLIKQNGFKLKKARRWWYPTKTMSLHPSVMHHTPFWE